MSFPPMWNSRISQFGVICFTEKIYCCVFPKTISSPKTSPEEIFPLVTHSSDISPGFFLLETRMICFWFYAVVRVAVAVLLELKGEF